MSSSVNKLLQVLQDYIGCMYLSDLHSGYYNEVICEAVAKIRAEDYSVDDWNEAVVYITYGSCVCSSAQEARDYLLKQCRNGRDRRI